MSTRKSPMINFALAVKGHLTSKVTMASEIAGVSFWDDTPAL